MARISVIFFFSRHRHCAIIFYFSATATAPPFSVRPSGAVALKVVQVPSTAYMHSWAQLTNNLASANRQTLTQTQNLAQLIAKR